MKKGRKILVVVASLALIAVVMADVFSMPSTMDGLIYYTFNTPSQSWQEASLWGGLLFAAVSLLYRMHALAGRIIEACAAVCSALMMVILVKKLYSTVVFVASGQSVLLIETTHSVFSDTLGRISGIALMLFVLFRAIYVYFDKP
jgi:hypothetical protein